MADGSKRCLRCGQDLPVEAFSKHRSRPDGLQAYCKSCTSEANRANGRRNRERSNIATPTTKACARCGQVKSADEFHVDRRRRDGLYSNCKVCHRVITDRWKAGNPSEVSRAAKASYRRHAPKRREEARLYRLAHVERYRANARKWKRLNRQRATAIEAIRRGRKRDAPGDATPSQIAARIDYYGGRCWMCGAPWEHIDHVKPLAKGGSNWPANLRPACGPCNLAKSDHWPLAA